MKSQQEKQLIILHFNDAYNIQTNKNGQLGFINFYQYVQNIKNKYPEALLVFSGDAFAPSKLSRLFKGQQMVHCLNLLNIDIACYGNHDFDFPSDHALKLAKSCNFKWLLGNIKYKQTNNSIGNGLDYQIIQHNKIKIGFIGLGGPDFIGRLISEYKGKLQYIELTQYAQKICKILRQKGCQLIVAVTHCRMPADQLLAKSVPNIDIILGGHDHQRIVKNINKIPLIKSGCDFQFLSIVKISNLSKNNKQKQQNIIGRRWFFQIQVKQVKKAKNKYPELQQFIQDKILKRKKFDDKRSIQNNIVKKQKIIVNLPEDQWLITFGKINNRNTISLKAGLSAQVCFAKYMAFKRKMFYVGYKKSAPQITQNFIEQSLKFIQKQIKSHKDNGNTILYSPGICSVPYLFQTSNFVYLPSQFLIGINKISELQICLKRANEKGIKCYAVLGYDPFIKNQLSCWIKFIQIPQIYIDIINYVNPQNIVIMSVYDQNGKSHGHQRNSRLLKRIKQNIQYQYPQQQDIYVIFMNQSYNISLEKDIQIFNKIIQDIQQQQWVKLAKSKNIDYLHDWQSGIDCIKQISQKTKIKLNNKNKNIYRVSSNDSWNLYLLSYYLGKKYISFNFQQNRAKGIVFNQYIMSNPSYQLNYGYIPILYWQFYPKNQQRILSILNQQQQTLKRWFNMHKGTHIKLTNKESKIIQTSHEGYELAAWVTKHAPLQYNNKFISFQIFLQTLKQHKMIHLIN